MKRDIVLILLIIAIIADKATSQRRITNGKDVSRHKRYMAYLLKAPISPYQYDEWICGGAIVTPLFIVTSAACVEDIQYMYAIAGYKKYVPAEKINDDTCTRMAKKKVVFTCVPKTYDLDYARVANWSFIDIAAVRVESPYDFNAALPLPFCSWVPDMIEINYDPKHTIPGVDVLVYGWGHKSIWRKIEDKKDYNQENLQWGSTLILDKEVCKRSYSQIPGITPVIDRYMVCTNGDGAIDEDGRGIIKVPPTLDGCGPPLNNDNCTKGPDGLRMGMGGGFGGGFGPGAFGGGTFGNAGYGGGMGNLGSFNYYNFLRRKLDEELKEYETGPNTKVNQEDEQIKPEVKDEDQNKSEIPKASRRNLEYFQTQESTRRNGICQNDHGGPLVTWVGAFEVLIGVASVFLVAPKSRECKGPFLFTSTQCNGAFLGCVLTIFDDEKNHTTRDYTRSGGDSVNNMPLTPEQQADKQKRDDITRRYKMMETMNRRMCDLPPEERGFDMIQRRISWMQHPDGPAKNELAEDLLERPQIPLNMFHG